MSVFVFVVGSILLLTNPLHGVPTGYKEPPKDNFVVFLTFISNSMFSKDYQQALFNDTNLTCPNLWTQTDEEFKTKEASGILGSLPKLQELCQGDAEDLSPICRGALGISNYVCKANGGKIPPPKVEDLKNLTDVKGLCNSLVGNFNLTYKLCDIVNNSINGKTSFKHLKEISPLKETLETNCTFPHSNDTCVKHCAGVNEIPVCKIILQSLRTIVFWEEAKERSENINNSDGTDSQPNAVIPAAVLPNPTQLSVAQNSTQEVQETSTSDIRTTPANPPTKPTAIPTTNESKTVTSEKIPITTVSLVDEKQNGSPTLAISSSSAVPSDDLEEMGDFDFNAVDKPPKSEDEDQLLGDSINDEDDADKDMEKQVDINPDLNESPKPVQSYDPPFETDSDPINTHFIFYFIAFVVLSACGYLMYMRRKQIFAMVVEGRSSSRRRSNSLRDRPSSGSYRKLVNNLEEAITSSSVKNTNVIY